MYLCILFVVSNQFFFCFLLFLSINNIPRRKSSQFRTIQYLLTLRPLCPRHGWIFISRKRICIKLLTKAWNDDCSGVPDCRHLLKNYQDQIAFPITHIGFVWYDLTDFFTIIIMYNVTIYIVIFVRYILSSKITLVPCTHLPNPIFWFFEIHY